MLHPQLILDLNHELIFDNFAGGGGASTAIEIALGRHVDHAVNHDRFALGMHRINHAQTVHHHEDVFDVDPAALAQGRPVGLAHFSPDCRHFSKAKGGKPVEKKIRGLCLVMLRYAKIRVRVMTMENVEEIVTWGPLKRIKKKGKWGWYPDPKHIGRTWKAFLACLSTGIDPNHPDLPEILEVLAGTVTKEECVRGFGYSYDSRILRACDYGARTIRKRFFGVFRLDGKPIVWPAITHGNPKLPGFAASGLRPWGTIAECIDWQRPCPSIFLAGADAKAANCKRPLAPATLRRIAKGIDRYVLKAAEPFLVSLTHQGGDRVEATSDPINTITGAHRGEKALVVPAISKFHGSHKGRADGDTRGQTVGDPLLSQDTSNRFSLTEASLAPFITEHAQSSNQRNMPADEPGRTLCAGVKGGHMALVSGTVVNTCNGKHDDAPSRSIDPQGPIPTVTSAQKFALASGVLVGAGGPIDSGKPKPLDEPMNTQTKENHTALISAQLVVNTTGHPGSPVDSPTPTLTTGGHQALVTGTLIGAGGRAGQSRPRGPEEPLHTITSKADTCLAAATMVKLRGTNIGDSVEAPMHTVSAGGQHHAVVAASIIRHLGQSVGQTCDAPAPTVMPGGQGKTGLISAVMAQHNGGFNTVDARPMDEPCSTLSATGSQQQVVAASLAAYYGSEADGQAATEPARTITAKARQCLVESTAASHLTPEQLAGAHRVAAFLRAHGVEFDGPFATVAGHIMIDIGMRMLTPRELFRAQGFPESYIIDKAWIWNSATSAYDEVTLTKEQQIRMCGNSVSPDPYAELVRANVPELILHSRAVPALQSRRHNRRPQLTTA